MLPPKSKNQTLPLPVKFKKSQMLIRIFDILFSLTIMIVISPIFVFVCFLNLLTGDGKIFFFQKRIGSHGQPFWMIKFATMRQDRPGELYKGFVDQNDERLLPFGKLLRKTKVNELPQLINVLKGDMSLVGYRPMIEITYSVALEKGYIGSFKQKPGLTGLASIIFRHEEELLQSKADRDTYYFSKLLPLKLSLDNWWEKNASISNYFKIIVLTAIVLVFSKTNLHKHLLKDLPTFEIPK